MPRITAIGTAVPEYIVDQRQARQFSRQLFAGALGDIDRLLNVFARTNIKKRHFCRPPEWFAQEHSFPEKNRLYIENGIKLGVQAVENCLHQAGLSPREVDCLIFVSTTGIATPTLDVHIANQLGFKRQVRRIPIWGLGCAGGTAGISRAFEQAALAPGRQVVVLALELCGLTFIPADHSKSNLIATALFGDGAAAALVSSQAAGPRIIGGDSILWPGTPEVMGWEVTDAGLKVIFSRDIPAIVRKHLRPVVDEFLAGYDLTVRDISRFIPHPGGTKVIEAYQEAFGFTPEMTLAARSVLENYGNMSSATVFFVLAEILADPPPAGSFGLMVSLGPGFAAELALLRW
ncbi:MAG: 3-oxoacyl-[acyl-carrier-protein] synthase III C-terminal domain-containing protein [Heliobacteriaceae bacterium]|nr:3-oxoacyl-[acyl-carrier-protein] synthase III C-terminal domain-containing protein [Heliobacteriaceae bacterium]